MMKAVRPILSTLAGPVLSLCGSTFSCRRRSSFLLQFSSPLLAHTVCCGIWTGTDFADIQLKVCAEGAETAVALYTAGGPFPVSYKTLQVFSVFLLPLDESSELSMRLLCMLVLFSLIAFCSENIGLLVDLS